VDLTALIFVALVVAWAVYLIPQARRHHDEVSSSRSVDRFSSTMRVLARRETAESRVVVTPARAGAAPVVTTKAQSSVQSSVAQPASAPSSQGPSRRPSAAQIRARRAAAKKAAQRRRRVLGTILTLNVIVAAVAAFGVIGWVWQAAPATLLVAWLVTCRLMVRSEQAQATWSPVRIKMPTSLAETATETEAVTDEVPADIVVERNDQGFDEIGSDADTSTIPAVREPLWDPVPTTLPTYVSKPAATRRTVRTIDLGAPGTWTSGRTEESSAIAREADQAERDAKVSARQRREQRRTGS
jgi:hypothetical protein